MDSAHDMTHLSVSPSGTELTEQQEIKEVLPSLVLLETFQYLTENEVFEHQHQLQCFNCLENLL